ncbi:hypothetical protein MUCCIDRAFT_104262 [Mucor lusitanicus CBS 277.49]|uniref:Uncharacterized protein n=1 Tax=Mucor lusitanicus CBS 277.49 TaxID=747725 RepID=A0A162TUX1_MUCCL|nr:hypothetical protein MUCCIDRAFT_104262 [Mucor lusitanicus CBS 277.49]
MTNWIRFVRTDPNTVLEMAAPEAEEDSRQLVAERQTIEVNPSFMILTKDAAAEDTVVNGYISSRQTSRPNQTRQSAKQQKRATTARAIATTKDNIPAEEILMQQAETLSISRRKKNTIQRRKYTKEELL